MTAYIRLLLSRSPKNASVGKIWTLWESNPRPHAIHSCEACALPTVPKAHYGTFIAIRHIYGPSFNKNRQHMLDNDRNLSRAFLDRRHSKSVHHPLVLHSHRLAALRPIRHRFPYRVYVRTVDIACTIPTPAPYCRIKAWSTLEAYQHTRSLTMRRPRYKLDFLAFFRSEKSVMRSKPGSILGICTRIIRETSKADVSPYSGQIASLRMYDIKHFLHVQSSMSNSTRVLRCAPCRMPISL